MSTEEEIPKVFEICDRILVATKDLEPKDLILEEYPLVFGPKSQKIDNGPFPCIGCCKSLDNQESERCPECFWPICNIDCLKGAKFHDFECRILRLRPQQPNNSFYQYYRFDILIILRLLSLQKKDEQKWNQLLNLNYHLDRRNLDSEEYKNVQEKINFLEENFWMPLKTYEHELGEQIISDTSSDLIHKLYGILEENSLELDNVQLVYPTVPFLEHNCVPNTVHKIDDEDNFKITVRACLPIKTGDHPTISHTNPLLGTHSRLQDLKKRYTTCSCQRCSDPSELGSFLSGLKCFGTEKSICGGLQLPLKPLEENTDWQCCKCPITLPNVEIMKFVDHLGKEADKVLDKESNLEELKDVLNKLLNFLNPNHYLLYRIKHKIVLLGDDTEEKVKLCDELIEVSQKVDPENARLDEYITDFNREKYKANFSMLIKNFDPQNTEKFLPVIKDLLTVAEKFNFDVEPLRNWVKEKQLDV